MSTQQSIQDGYNADSSIDVDLGLCRGEGEKRVNAVGLCVGHLSRWVGIYRSGVGRPYSLPRCDTPCIRSGTDSPVWDRSCR